MAKIHIKSRDPVEVTNTEAKKIDKIWQLNPKSADILTIGNSRVKIRDIRGISGVSSGTSVREYDLSDPIDRKAVKDFEQEYLTWKSTDGKAYSGFEAESRFLATKDACRIDETDSIYKGDVIVTDIVLYNQLGKLWRAMKELRYRREKAKELDDQQLQLLTE